MTKTIKEEVKDVVDATVLTAKDATKIVDETKDVAVAVAETLVAEVNEKVAVLEAKIKELFARLGG